MTFKELQAEMITAMKEKNKNKKTVLADIITTAKNMAIAAGCKDSITDAIVMDAIMKAKKSCQEQIDTCPAERVDLLTLYNENMSYINLYAPQMMALKELEIKIPQFLDSIDETWMTWNKGQIMKVVIPAFKGKAEGKDINKAVELTLKGLRR